MTIPVIIKKSLKKNIVSIELPLERFEQFAAACGLYRKEFLESLERAEEDIKQGKVKRLRQFTRLRKPLKK